jgi:hypothetical protein
MNLALGCQMQFWRRGTSGHVCRQINQTDFVLLMQVAV